MPRHYLRHPGRKPLPIMRWFEGNCEMKACLGMVQMEYGMPYKTVTYVDLHNKTRTRKILDIEELMINATYYKIHRHFQSKWIVDIRHLPKI